MYVALPNFVSPSMIRRSSLKIKQIAKCKYEVIIYIISIITQVIIEILHSHWLRMASYSTIITSAEVIIAVEGQIFKLATLHFVSVSSLKRKLI